MGLFSLPSMFVSSGSFASNIGILVPLLLGGEIAGLIVELVLVTPILMAVRFLRWRWLRLWVAALMGAAIGEAVAALFMGQGLGGGGDPQTLVRAGVAFGLVGIVAGVVFHLIAMRRVKVQSPAEVF